MTKLITINKSDLHVKDGYLLDAEDNLVAAPYQAAVVDQFHKLVGLLEKAAYLEAQPDASPAPSLDGFDKKVSRVGLASEIIDVDEWAMDILEAKADEKHLMDAALEEVVFTDQVREVAADFLELYNWCENDSFSYRDEAAPIHNWDPRMLVLTGEEVTAGLIKWVEQRNRMGAEQEACGCCPGVKLPNKYTKGIWCQGGSYEV